MTRLRSLLLPAAALLLVLAAALPAFSHLPMYTRPSGGGSPVMDHWNFSAFPVAWNLNPQQNGNIGGGRSIAAAVQASFNTWVAAPNAGVQVARGSDSGDSAAGFSQNSSSNTNLICFVCQADFSQEAETLAITFTTVSNGAGGNDGHGGQTTNPGQILDADILFNPNRQFSTDAGSQGVEDLQTIATHEIGHFLGLDHSGIVRATMFAYAPLELRTLAYDDVAGIGLLYPAANPAVAMGSITGSVTRSAGGAVFGAHVFAESVSNAHPLAAYNVRKGPISTLTLPDGSYRITGLPPDGYRVTAEPLDLPTNDGNIEGYATAFGQTSVQTNFTTRWY